MSWRLKLIFCGGVLCSALLPYGPKENLVDHPQTNAGVKLAQPSAGQDSGEQLGNLQSQSPDSGPSITKLGHAKPPMLSPLTAQTIKSVKTFGARLVQLNEQPLNELSHDELSLRFYLARNCSDIAFLRDSENGLMTAIRQRPERFSQARLQAIKTLTEACHGVPASMFGVEAMSQLYTEMLRRQDRPVGRMATLPINYALWNELNDLHKLAASGDALAFSYALSMLNKYSIITVMGEAIKAEDFLEAWHLATCELAGGCGPDSLHVLERCALSNQCGASSLLEAIRMHEPERYPLLLKLYPKLVQAFTSANWSGFDWSRARIDAKVVSLGPVEHDHLGKSDRPMR